MLISYPRTDSRHLSQVVAKTLPRIVRVIVGPYRDHIAPGRGERPLSRRFVDDKKVGDHHAIIPTAASPEKLGASSDERKIYDLICRRLLTAWHDDYITAITTVITAVTSDAFIDRFHTSGTAVQQLGWKVLDPVPERPNTRSSAAETEATEPSLPPGLAIGQPQNLIDIEAQKKKTRPPKRFTEATLLTAMETAGKSLEEKELSDAMKESGLGTPATRAAIIETLLKREYIVRKGKSLEATDKGIRLIEAVHPEVKSPVMTGQWEAYLQRIQRGTAQLAPFLEGIENYVREVVGKVGDAPRNGSHIISHTPSAGTSADTAGKSARAACDADLQGLLRNAFGFESFRPNQEAVCRAVIEGRDVLLVMLTGTGKSLCYQLPGIARGGTTLVISPLIALIEDQVGKLKEFGFAVERVHSGRDRKASRQACIDYLEGKLQFLFIAPERLRVSGFPDMLAKRKPSLIAVDEAHCISQWGHDFRPDYRMLGQHLPSLRPAPIIALTATATPLVQRDIAEQLGLQRPARMVHGFRRDNIAIEAIEVPPDHRSTLAREVLLKSERRPAIIYVPTRKQAEQLAVELAPHFPAEAYHAGLDAKRRNEVQQNFLGGNTEVMVATIAFGMGIDKPDIRTVMHTALPGSLEGYYQEIGRAGRDGAPSRAILMHSYADRRTHDYFFERDYPDVSVLDEIYALLTANPAEKDELRKQARTDPELFDKALEKLWTHGGAMLDYSGRFTRGDQQWRQTYLAQAEQKAAQLDLMIRYADSHQCRMNAVVRHFGDLSGSRTPCGICDFCAPAQCVAQRFRAATATERAMIFRVLNALRSGGPRSTGKLHAELCPNGELSRDAFEEVLGAMGRDGLLRHVDAVFEKDGKQIPYRNVILTRRGCEVNEQTPVEFVMKDSDYAPEPNRRSRKARGSGKSRKRKRKSR
jgi:DNA topoisomerase III